ncbi:MAG: hypothetical protein LC130_24710, partial [Bryobacterales bacterium]|nr:hypothetical protein [Bryobacterales bacterium]
NGDRHQFGTLIGISRNPHNLGGTIQHLLYSGIVQNFADGDPETDHLIDCIDGIERVLIDHGIIPSDFVLLVGRRG